MSKHSKGLWKVGEYPKGAAVRSITIFDDEGGPVATIRDAALRNGEVRHIPRRQQLDQAHYIVACVNYFRANAKDKGEK